VIISGQAVPLLAVASAVGQYKVVAKVYRVTRPRYKGIDVSALRR
jgi:hypothetical protein